MSCHRRPRTRAVPRSCSQAPSAPFGRAVWNQRPVLTRPWCPGRPDSPPRRSPLAGPPLRSCVLPPRLRLPVSHTWQIALCGLLGGNVVSCAAGLVILGGPTGHGVLIRATGARLRSCIGTWLARNVVGAEASIPSASGTFPRLSLSYSEVASTRVGRLMMRSPGSATLVGVRMVGRAAGRARRARRGRAGSPLGSVSRRDKSSRRWASLDRGLNDALAAREPGLTGG